MIGALKCLSIPAVLLAVSISACAQATYTVHDLGTIGGSTTPGAINAVGHAVGHSFTAPGSNFYHVIINRGAGVQDLGTMGGYGAEANDINATGQIVGGSSPPGGGHFHAYLYQNGVWTDLGVGGGYRSYAYGVNAAGDVVGAWLALNGNWTGFLYRNGVMTDLPNLGGASGEARAINDQGHIAGFARTASNAVHAYIRINGVMTDLGTLGGSTSNAHDLNEQGQVVGQSLTSSGNNRAFIYTAGQMRAVTDWGGRGSRANAINNRSEIVGWANPAAGGQRAFIYRWNNPAAGMIDLNTLLPPGSGWVLTDAVDINDVGEIVGTGTLNGAARAFVLRPAPRVWVDVSTVSVGDTVAANWTAPNGSSSVDWIGLYRDGAADTDMLAFAYTGGATSGSIPFSSPNQAGSYHFRYFVNNSYTLKSTSASFQVLVPAVTLTASPTAVNPGSNVTVSFTAPAGQPALDWIGLYRVGDDNRAYRWWTYTNGAASATYNLAAPSEPGDYEFRYLINNGYTDVARSNPFRVNSATYLLSGSPATVASGGAITVQWTAPDGSSNTDWVGLYREGEPENRNYLWPHWFYTDGAPTGSRSLTMPAAPGRYVLRYLLNNTYIHTAESTVIVVE